MKAGTNTSSTDVDVEIELTPNGNVNSANFGKILSTDANWAMGRSRQFRFGFRVTF